MSSTWHFLTVFVCLELCLAIPHKPRPAGLIRRGPIIDCDQFTTTGNDADYSLNCTEYDGQGGYPRMIAGGQVDFYHYTDGYDANDPQTQSIVTVIENALQNVLPTYEGFGTDFDVIVILSPTLVDKKTGSHDEGEEQTKAGTRSPCFLRIAADASSITEAVAHEGYQCVEDANRDPQTPIGDVEFNGWWSEAVPEYYSDVFYPSHSVDSYPRKYLPDTPLYEQPYSAGLFWVFLGGYGWDYAKINNFVFNEPNAQSLDEARTRISSHTDLADAFPAFATAFVDDTIVYADGSAVDPLNKIGTIDANVLTLPDCGSHDWGAKTPSWTISTFGLLIDSGQSFTMTWNPTDDHKTLFYRQSTPSGGDWVDMTSTPATIVLTCEDDVASLDFVFTCTADVDECAGVVTVLQISRLECPGDTPADTCSTQPPTPTPTPTPSTPPPSSPGEIDGCLRGTWNLDIVDMQSLLQTQVGAANDGAAVTNIQVTGSATFVVPDSGSTSTFTFSGLEIDMDITVVDPTLGTISAHSSATTNGNVGSTIVMGTGNEFTWTSVQASGMTKIIVTIQGFDPSEDDEDLSQAYGTSLVVDYVCSASSLTLIGKLSGKYQWSYVFNKA